MPKFTLTALASLCLFQLSTLAQDTTWYDAGWKPTVANKAFYFRTKIKTDSGWSVTDHYQNGKAQMTGLYSDDSLHVRQGVFRWYDPKGTITSLSTYAGDKVKGLEVQYYEDGTEKLKGTMEGKQRDGLWMGYFPSGRLAATATYHAGNRVAITLYKEDGSHNNKDTVFEHEAQYPGGSARLLYFLNKHLRYPDSAVVHKIEGTVVVRIHVSKEGKITDLLVDQSINQYLDTEALRVMRLMPDWEPAIMAGVPIDSYRLQPVVFKLTTD